MSRDYNFREHHRDRVVKRRILNTVYARRYYDIGYRRRYTYYEKDPDGSWFNYIGEYHCRFKSGGFGINRRYGRYYYDNLWKVKYYNGRVTLKKHQRREINDEIGERYYISY